MLRDYLFPHLLGVRLPKVHIGEFQPFLEVARQILILLLKRHFATIGAAYDMPQQIL